MFSRSLVECGLDRLCRNRASRGGALPEYFLSCLHVQGCGLSVVTGIEHGHALVDGLLDDVVGVAGNLFGFRDQNRIDDVYDSI